MVFSASFPSAYYETGDGAYYFKRQLIFAVLGLFAMVVMSRINYQRLRGASKLLLGFAVFLLVLVIVPKNPLAITNNNATRWLGTEGFSFQPPRSPSWRWWSTLPTVSPRKNGKWRPGATASCRIWRCWD